MPYTVRLGLPLPHSLWSGILNGIPNILFHHFYEHIL